MRGLLVLEHGFELLVSGLGAGGTLLVAVLHLPTHLGKHRQDELLLGLEVIVDQALRHARLLGDLFDRGVLVTLAGQDGERGLEDLAPGVG